MSEKSWTEKHPKPEPIEHVGPEPKSLDDTWSAWNKRRREYNKFVVANRKHLIAKSLDQLPQLDSSSPTEVIVRVLAIAHLEDEHDEASPFASLFGF